MPEQTNDTIGEWLRAEQSDDQPRAEARLTALFTKVPRPSPSPGFAARVAAQTRRVPTAASRPLPRWASWLAAALVVAALCAPLRLARGARDLGLDRGRRCRQAVGRCRIVGEQHRVAGRDPAAHVRGRRCSALGLGRFPGRSPRPDDHRWSCHGRLASVGRSGRWFRRSHRVIRAGA